MVGLNIVITIGTYHAYTEVYYIKIQSAPISALHMMGHFNRRRILKLWRYCELG